MLRERVRSTSQLLLGGLLLGTLLGVCGGPLLRAHPRRWRTRVLHVATALLLSCPPYFLAFMVLIYFSSNSGDFSGCRSSPGRATTCRSARTRCGS